MAANGTAVLAHDCSFCEPPRRATSVLHDELTDLVVYCCERHYTALAKLRGFTVTDFPDGESHAGR